MHKRNNYKNLCSEKKVSEYFSPPTPYSLLESLKCQKLNYRSQTELVKTVVNPRVCVTIMWAACTQQVAIMCKMDIALPDVQVFERCQKYGFSQLLNTGKILFLKMLIPHRSNRTQNSGIQLLFKAIAGAINAR